MTSESGFSGKRLRKFREDKKLTRAAVARRAGVDAEEIEQIETGALDPVLGRLLRIAEAIEVPLADLFSLPPAATEVTIHITPTDAAASGAAVHIIPVPIVLGEIAAGNARIVDDAILGWLVLLKEEFGRQSSNLAAVRIVGKSMEPELPGGCVAVVDRNDRVITSEGIYAVRDPDGGCTVKRIEVLDAEHAALIPSNRSEFKVEFIKLELGESIADRTIGRVIWIGQSFASGTQAAENSPPYGRADLGLAKDFPQPPPEDSQNSF